MRNARAVPPISTKPASVGCSRRKFQRRSVSGGSEVKAMGNVLENPLDHGPCPLGLERVLLGKNAPFTHEPFHAEDHCGLQQAIETRIQQCGAQVHGIVGLWIRPHEAAMLLPHRMMRGHEGSYAQRAGLANSLTG